MPIVASLETIGLVLESVYWHMRVRAQMRSNAARYPQAIDELINHPVQPRTEAEAIVEVASVMDDDARGFIGTLNGLADIDNDAGRRTVLLTCLERMTGGTRTECRAHVQAMIAELRGPADAMLAASKTTRAEIQAASNLWTAIPAHTVPVRREE